MIVLVTGVAGFIGSYTARKFLSEGHEVIGVDNFDPMYSKKAKLFNLRLIEIQAGLLAKGKRNLNEFSIFELLRSYQKETSTTKGSFVFYEADIRDPKEMLRLFKKHKPDILIHLAALGGVPDSMKRPLQYIETNVLGTTNLLELSVQNDLKHFVFASSSSIYGDTDMGVQGENTDADKPISQYSASKRMSEILGYTYNSIYNLPFTCLRFFTVYGPLQRPYGMAIQKFIRQTLENKPHTLYGDGSMQRDYTYIDDTVEGIYAASQKPIGYIECNIGCGNAISLINLSELIIQNLKKGSRIFIDKPPTEVLSTLADISKAQAVFGYTPKIAFDEGLRRQIEVFLEMPDWYKSI